jgi:hypothetical protein
MQPMMDSPLKFLCANSIHDAFRSLSNEWHLVGNAATGDFSKLFCLDFDAQTFRNSIVLRDLHYPQRREASEFVSYDKGLPKLNDNKNLPVVE